jgi:hypothetical protein
MSFAIATLLYLFSFDVYYFLLKFYALIVSPLKYILYRSYKQAKIFYSPAEASILIQQGLGSSGLKSHLLYVITSYYHLSTHVYYDFNDARSLGCTHAPVRTCSFDFIEKIKQLHYPAPLSLPLGLIPN